MASSSTGVNIRFFDRRAGTGRTDGTGIDVAVAGVEEDGDVPVTGRR